jgi:hypothetical protein
MKGAVAPFYITDDERLARWPEHAVVARVLTAGAVLLDEKLS